MKYFEETPLNDAYVACLVLRELIAILRHQKTQKDNCLNEIIDIGLLSLLSISKNEITITLFNTTSRITFVVYKSKVRRQTLWLQLLANIGLINQNKTQQ